MSNTKSIFKKVINKDIVAGELLQYGYSESFCKIIS
jgi:hypothetical protein